MTDMVDEALVRLKDSRIVSADNFCRAMSAGLSGDGIGCSAEQVKSELELLLAGKKWTNVVGCFVEGEISSDQSGL